MKRLFVVFYCFIAILVSGCAQNHFNVPTSNFADRVKVLGVVPIMVDGDSDIKHPQKDILISLLSEKNRSFESQFIRRLKATGNFYAVALLGSDPDDLFKKLLFRREQRDDATIKYNKYFWKTELLKEYIQKNNLDAVMMIVVSGLTQETQLFSSNFLNSLTANYNYIIMTAQILDTNGTILWEYPNFRQRVLSYNPMINLQYPDFSESDANKSSITNVKFKTIEGIKRTLEEKKTDLLLRETQESEVYGKQFDEMISLLNITTDKSSKGELPPQPTPATKQSSPPAGVPQAPAATTPTIVPSSASTQPAVPVVTHVPVLAPASESAAQPTVPKAEVAPANGSTL